ncbi:MAG: S1 family peptidase, partial [Pyrinomonadaceae bacterium]
EGTGFHVGGGFIVTNRHIAVEPWKADERVQSLSASVNGQFRLTRLVAYFPGHRQPFVLRFRQASSRDDLAVCTIEGRDVPEKLPALPLNMDSDAVVTGQAVVLMGYPKGVDRIMASLPEAESRNLQMRYGNSLGSLLAALAERNLIKPLTTQGHITELDEHRLSYDARSAQGGSGAPLFGQTGRVIGINFMMYVEMPDANYAVPVRYAASLLQRAGWKPPETSPAEAAAAGNTNTTQKDPRPTAPGSKPPSDR